MVNKAIAIIPARGGSKRIPRKNIIPLEGKPMICWTIEAALKSKYISRVIVSTDDQEIADIAVNYGAEVPFLRDSHADDHAPISMATYRTIEKLSENGILGEENIIVQLMANCPLRDANDIDTSIEEFINNNNKFQISSFKYGWMNPWWAHKVDKDGTPETIFKNGELKKRSQDLPELYCPTGAIWIAQKDGFIEQKTFYGSNYKFSHINWINAIDIDDYDDLEMASYYLKQKAV